MNGPSWNRTKFLTGVRPDVHAIMLPSQLNVGHSLMVPDGACKLDTSMWPTRRLPWQFSLVFRTAAGSPWQCY